METLRRKVVDFSIVVLVCTTSLMCKQGLLCAFARDRRNTFLPHAARRDSNIPFVPCEGAPNLLGEQEKSPSLKTLPKQLKPTLIFIPVVRIKLFLVGNGGAFDVMRSLSSHCLSSRNPVEAGHRTAGSDHRFDLRTCILESAYPVVCSTWYCTVGP
ncbi:hypothetical protein T439DRAFT_244349 [Meredithblackwellia eburnea MCA 4105]